MDRLKKPLMGFYLAIIIWNTVLCVYSKESTTSLILGVLSMICIIGSILFQKIRNEE
jgi:hypothetical protein